ncbi:MAG: DUF554 domain-containing protein [Bacteroidaceae bacterium]|nr:DUF554 domain-containing protein [Bacteroidaceae bacterium]
MLGTITNTCTIIVGSLIGGALKRGIRPEWQSVLFTAMGLASLALGFNAVCRNMPNSEYPVLFIISLSVGGLLGTMLDLDGRFKRLVDSFSKPNQSVQPSPSSTSSPSSSPSLAQGLSTGVLLYCIGTLSIVGPINSALLGDNTYLFTNATLDLVTSAVLAATYGFGMVLAAPVLFCWQGSIYLVAKFFGDVISSTLLCEIQIVGGVLIVASGLALLNIKDCKTLNLLPSLFVPVIYFLILALV